MRRDAAPSHHGLRARRHYYYSIVIDVQGIRPRIDEMLSASPRLLPAPPFSLQYVQFASSESSVLTAGQGLPARNVNR